MDKGWGLTLESDPLSFFPPSTTSTISTSTSTTNNHHTSPALLNSSFFKISKRFDHNSMDRDRGRDRDRDDSSASTTRLPAFRFPVRESSPAGESHHRLPVDEVDFFSDKIHRAEDDVGNKTTTVLVKKEENSTTTAHDVNTGLRLLTANTGSDQSTVDDGVSSDHVVDDNKPSKSKNELAQLQVELQVMNAENLKLKDMLRQVSSNYATLHMHLVALMQRQQQQNQDQLGEAIKSDDQEKKPQHDQMVPRQFMDLGPSGADQAAGEISQSSSDERTRSASPQNNQNNNLEVGSVKNNNNIDQETNPNGKRIATREETPESETQGWNPNKSQKLSPAATNNSPIDQANTEATMRKARVSVRARSEAPMITDGCQWRKYGQKMAKGNPCPRAYYRCTMAVGCPVRKQVQRCAEDRTILITTYEGNHNHPLPPAAMAMASTTTAAATMLLSGSMSSADGQLMNPNLLARAILPCSSSMATISASAPFPTVTLDLTHNPTNPLQMLQRPPSHPHPPQFHLPNFPLPSGQMPQNFGSHLPQVFGQGSLYNQSKFSGLQLSQDIGSSQLGQQQQQPQQPSLVDTVSAATAAITADPNFTAALAAAISSIIGGANTNNTNNNRN